MVEQRHPCLERVRHRVAVLVAQELGQPAGREEELELPAQPVRERGAVARRRGGALAQRGPDEGRRTAQAAARREPEPLGDVRRCERDGCPRGAMTAGEGAQLPGRVDDPAAADHVGEPVAERRAVAGEDLVAALAVQHHREPGLACGAHDVPARADRRRAEGLALRLNDRRKVGRELRGVERHPVRLRADLIDDGSGERALVESGVLEVRGHRLLVLVTQMRDRDRDGGRVDASREARADRDVAPQLQTDGIQHGLADRLDRVCRRLARLERPVPTEAQSFRSERERVRGWQADDAGEERLVPFIQIPLLEVVVDRTEIRLSAPQRPRLTGEREARTVDAVVEGLDAEPVARAEERLATGIPDAKRPHAVEPLDAPLAPFAVRREDDLAVRGGTETMSLRRELLPQLDVVVDLAVVQQLQLTVRHRLQAGVGEVDDREAQMPETGRVVDEDAASVRTAVREIVEPSLDDLPLGRPVEVDHSREAAHQRGRFPASAYAAAAARTATRRTFGLRT